MRLTEYTDIGYVFANSNFSDDLSKHNEELEIAINKLLNLCGQLEDIEEELGIGLITLFKALKALKNGFYYRNPWSTDKEIKYANKSDVLSNWGLCVRNLTKTGWGFVLMSNRNTYFILEEYGVTWALERSELECQNM